jgi:hypothetical protein
MRLFGRKKVVEEPKETLETEMKDLDKLTVGADSVDIPELPSELTRLKEVAEAEAEKITGEMEETETLIEPAEVPKPVEEKPEVQLEELPLKEMNEKIDEELKQIKKRMDDLGSLKKLTLESPEMISLMELYTEYKDKLNQFVEEINSMDFSSLASKRTFAAIYKFRACKALSEMKKQIKKIEALCKKAGFIPTKVHEILESSAEDLVKDFLDEKSEEE